MDRQKLADFSTALRRTGVVRRIRRMVGALLADLGSLLTGPFVNSHDNAVLVPVRVKARR